MYRCATTNLLITKIQTFHRAQKLNNLYIIALLSGMVECRHD